MANCYNNGTIYKLCCKDPTIKDIYVGSTCAFRRRKNAHKTDCTNENSKKYNLNVYQFIRDHGGWDNWDMIEIKQFNCETKRELETEERAVLEMLGGTLNSITPCRGRKERSTIWRKKNKELVNERKKAWREANKEQINEKQREKVNCGCGGAFSKVNKLRHFKSLKHQKYLNSIC